MKNLRNYLLLLLSILLVLLCFEVGFRVRAWCNDLGRLPNRDDPVIAPRHGETVKLGHMIRMSGNPDLIYELIPDRVHEFKHQVVRVNADGFRGPSIPRDKPAGTVRILGIGDSVMFGWGVAEKETYLARLSERLNRRYPEVTWDVINSAVPGYNSALEVAALRVKGLRLEPDIVVVGFLANDLNLPNFIRDASALWTLRRSFLLDYLSGRAPALDLIEAPGASQGTGFEGDPRRVPAAYRAMVGENGYRAAMRELKSLSVDHGFEVVMFSHSRLPAFAKELSNTLGFSVVETEPVWLAYVSRRRLPDPMAVWRLGPRDPHPSAIGHEVMAEALLEGLWRNGLIDRAVQRYCAQRRGQHRGARGDPSHDP